MISLIKFFLRYTPLSETKNTREQLKFMENELAGIQRPFVPSHEGDLIYLLIKQRGYSRCLETGFATGSTARYMLSATENVTGRVISIDNSQGGHEIEMGKRCIEESGMGSRHQFFEGNSANVIRQLIESGEEFDFVFIDGWKTFDHLAYELFLIDQMLFENGVVFFDDTYLPSVRQTIRLLTRYYEYQEINYSEYKQDWRLRLHLSASVRSIFRPYRVFQKMRTTDKQERTFNPYFFRSLN